MTFLTMLCIVHLKFNLVSTEDSVGSGSKDALSSEQKETYEHMDEEAEELFAISRELIIAGTLQCTRYCWYLPNCIDALYQERYLRCQILYNSEKEVRLDRRNRCFRECGYTSVCILTRQGHEVCVVVGCRTSDVGSPSLIEVGHVVFYTMSAVACRGNGELEQLDKSVSPKDEIFHFVPKKYLEYSVEDSPGIPEDDYGEVVP